MWLLFFGLSSMNCGEGVLNGAIDFAIVRVPPCGVKLKAFLDELQGFLLGKALSGAFAAKFEK